MNSPSTAAYSGLLLSYVEPVCNDAETEATFFKKCELGKIVWNYYIAREFDLSVKNDLGQAIDKSNEVHPEMKQVVDLLMERKRLFFGEHKNFIFHMEVKNRPGGPTLYVESIPPEKMREILAKVNSPKE
jgi:hypothetical protein